MMNYFQLFQALTWHKLCSFYESVLANSPFLAGIATYLKLLNRLDGFKTVTRYSKAVCLLDFYSELCCCVHWPVALSNLVNI